MRASEPRAVVRQAIAMSRGNKSRAAGSAAREAGSACGGMFTLTAISEKTAFGRFLGNGK